MPSPNLQWLYVAVLVAVAAALHGLRRRIWLFALVVLPGTVAHEGTHLLTGWALNAQPAGFTVLPRRGPGGWTLGAVSFGHVRWYNAFFVGMAPLLLLPAAYALLRWRLQGPLALGWQEALAVYLIANLLYAALPSWQDLRIAARSPIGWILLAAGLAWGWRAWRGGPKPGPGVAIRR